MQLKYLQTILEAQDYDFKIASLCWSPNNQKLAIATCDRQVLLYDEKGEKRDRFSTKPYDPEAGKRSYVITGIAFSPDSTKIAVAQSDCIIYVYKIGEKWGEKKAICNKFPQPSPVTCIVWLLTGPIICGLVDGKVRALQIKSNKSQSLFASDSLVVSLTSNSKGTGFLSGHVDGNVIRFYITNDHNEDEAQGRIALHSVPPSALAWPQGHIFVAGCDKRVSVYNNLGKLVKTFDYTKDTKEYDFTVAACSPSGQAVAIGSFDRLRVYIWNTRKSIWEETPPKEIVNFYTVTALAWKRDGSKVTCGGLGGAVFLFESVLPLRFSSASTSCHNLYVKQHSIRLVDESKPPDSTLFVLNVPPYATEESLKQCFSIAGKVKSVILQAGSSESTNNDGFKSGYVVFYKRESLLKSLKLDMLNPLSSDEAPLKVGIEKWIENYNSSVYAPKELQNKINMFMANYDKNEEQEKLQAKTNTTDDEGWTIVTKKGRKPKQLANQTSDSKLDKKSRKQKGLKNFYTFQIRESKMNKIVDLRKNFEEAKKKVNLMKQARKFKPY